MPLLTREGASVDHHGMRACAFVDTDMHVCVCVRGVSRVFAECIISFSNKLFV